MMHGRGKSDRSTVPMKPSNDVGQPTEERVEGKDLAEGNSTEGNAFRTQGRGDARSALERVRQAARTDRKQRFTALFHHVYNTERLHDAYLALTRDASAGVDGETWQHYGENLGANLADLAGRLKRGAYQARPVRRVYIPKPDGRARPIGVPTLEDKIVQRAVVEVLNAIYEQDFVGFSYGFRPGRNQHQALDALAVGLGRAQVNWVLDADIRGFFDTVDHAWLVKFIEHRIGDRRVVRLIQKWLNAGVLEDGNRTTSEVGTVQGGSISPLLANIYLHYVFDLWVRQWRTTRTNGDVIVVRFADDIIVGIQHRADAERFLTELRDRFATFGLALHPDKTRIVSFGPRAWWQRRAGRGKPGTFDFLGFTHISGTKRSGDYGLQRKTIRKRWHAKLHEVKTELRRRMHDPIPEQGHYLRSVLGGHFRYYGVPTNRDRLSAFRYHVKRLWWRSLNRRSQRSRTTWERMARLDRWLPPPRVCHPWPSERIDVTT
ncbi:group II intron reverse transcriptase/maturase [bacterium]|nr:MAG: group II intron reverse transcriptase/maturase [bacterium]